MSHHRQEVWYGPHPENLSPRFFDATVETVHTCTERSRLSADAPLMLEHLKTAEEYAEGRRTIQGVAEKLGLSFGT